MNPITVLIVDDDKNSLHLSYSAMSQLVAPEYIHSAENAAQTLDILKSQKIDLGHRHAGYQRFFHCRVYPG